MITYILATILTTVVAYLLGSIPSAVWIGKRYYGIDIREHGSKNAGTTNMLRVLGRKAALPVFAIDFIKGFVGVTFAGSLLLHLHAPIDVAANAELIAVVAAVLGHVFPIFAGFRGGKGVATIVGSVAAINPLVIGICFAVWFVLLLIWHYVSLASMCSGVLYFIMMLYTHVIDGDNTPISQVIFAFAVAVMLIYTHRTNIGRLRAGTESKIYVWRSRKAKEEAARLEEQQKENKE